MFKRYLAVLLALILVAALPIVTAHADASGDPVHLVWYTVGPEPKDNQEVVDAANEITRAKLNITFEKHHVDWGDYTSKLQIMLNAGDAIDLLFTANWAVDYLGNAQRGAFYRLDDPDDNLLEKYAPDVLKILHPGFWEGSKVNGGNYAVPVNKELPFQPVWNINVPMAEKYGIKYEDFTDYKSIEDALRITKEGEGDGFVAFNGILDWYAMNAMKFDMMANCGYIGIPWDVRMPDVCDYKFVNTLASADIRELAQIARRWYQNGYIRQDALLTDLPAGFEKEGKWLMGYYSYMPLQEITNSNNAGFKIAAVGTQPPIIATGSCTGSMIAIPITSNQPVEAMKMINLLNTDAELSQLLTYGIKDKHWTEDANGQMQMTELGQSNYNVANFTMQNCYIRKTFVGDPLNKWEIFDQFNQSGIPAPTLGFVPNLDPIQNELAAMNNVSAEFSKPLFAGAVDNPDETLDKFIEKYNAAGAEKVIAELQSQFDAWRAAQTQQ